MNEFLMEFRELLKKHKVEIKKYESYDGEEEPCGTDYALVSNDMFMDMGDLFELINKKEVS
jgi:hypothetical protein